MNDKKKVTEISLTYWYDQELMVSIKADVDFRIADKNSGKWLAAELDELVTRMTTTMDNPEVLGNLTRQAVSILTRENMKKHEL